MERYTGYRGYTGEVVLLFCCWGGEGTSVKRKQAVYPPMGSGVWQLRDIEIAPRGPVDGTHGGLDGTRAGVPANRGSARCYLAAARSGGIPDEFSEFSEWFRAVENPVWPPRSATLSSGGGRVLQNRFSENTLKTLESLLRLEPEWWQQRHRTGRSERASGKGSAKGNGPGS